MVLFLNNKFAAVLFGFCFLLFVTVAKSSVSVGVKKGDWMEYEVTTWGSPPEDLKVRYAKIEIVNVNGPKVVANVTTENLNGSKTNLTMTFDLEKGRIGAWFLVPADLDPGESFYDNSLDRIVMIEGEEQLAFAGATRTITKATTLERLKLWDKETGIFVECVDVFNNYSINATATRTNMWNGQVVGFISINLTAIVLFAFALSVAAVLVKSNLKIKNRLGKVQANEDIFENSFL